MLEQQPWKEALRVSLPVMFGYLPLGAAFGILAVEVGIPVWGAVLMSLIIYAGAGQFLAVALLGAGAGLVEVTVATLMLNSRHLFYGLSLLKRFKGAGWRKPYMIFALTDETYSLLTSQSSLTGQQQEQSQNQPSQTLAKSFSQDDHAQAFRISMLNQLWWILGSLFGAIASAAIEFDSRGIEFALTALFIVLTLEQARRLRRWLPFAIALACGFIALLLLPDQHLLLGAIGSASVLLLVHYRMSYHRNHAPGSERK